MGEFDDLLGDVIAEPPAVPQNEYLATQRASSDTDEELLDPKKLAEFIANTMTAPYEGIADTVISRGYAAVVWHFRQAAILGDIDRVRALKLWLDWAEPRIDRRQNPKDHINNPAGAGFGPREIKA